MSFLDDSRTEESGLERVSVSDKKNSLFAEMSKRSLLLGKNFDEFIKNNYDNKESECFYWELKNQQLRIMKQDHVYANIRVDKNGDYKGSICQDYLEDINDEIKLLRFFGENSIKISDFPDFN